MSTSCRLQVRPWQRITWLLVCEWTVLITLTAADAASDFPVVHNTEKDTNAAPPKAQESLALFTFPAGFNVSSFAAEPEVQNPIAMAWDSRGRLWIAENYTYAEPPLQFDLHFRDRILIFEDTDGDGRF